MRGNYELKASKSVCTYAILVLFFFFSFFVVFFAFDLQNVNINEGKVGSIEPCNVLCTKVRWEVIIPTEEYQN